MTIPAVQLWTGRTVHVRYTPFERQFQYRIALIDLDIDRLEEAAAVSRLFKLEKPGFFSFRAQDHGPRKKGAGLREWADNLFMESGIEMDGGPIRLVTFPRHLFYKFAPLSLWYGYGPDGDLRGVIYEVHNTFGEQHCYVAAVDAARAEHEAAKTFHVSPFMDLTGSYRFKLHAPEETLRAIIENWKDGRRTHMASIAARRQAMTTVALLRLATMQPFSSMGVSVGIHWQALKVWLRGARYRRKPVPPGRQATIATAVTSQGSVSENNGSVA